MLSPAKGTLIFFNELTQNNPYGHLSLKAHNVKFFLDIRFFNITAPITALILKTYTHCHAMISTHFKFSTLGCDVSFNQGYINVEFDIMYFQ